MTAAWHPSLDRRWFVVAQSRRLQTAPQAVTVLDRALVIARLHSGRAVAFDDRCPHRHFPLSSGRVTADGLQCGYHGWTFGADGRCTHVPGLACQGARPGVGLRAAQVIEHDGLVWLRLSGGDDAALPGFITQTPPGTLRFLWQTTWQANVVDALENFLDPLHTHFVHPGLVRRDGERRPLEAALRSDGETLTIDYTGAAEQSGWLYRLFESLRVLERVHHAAAAAGSARIEYRYRDDSALHFTLHFTPETTWRTRVHASLHVENRWAPAWAVRAFAWPLVRRVARQDQQAVERQAANRQRFGQTQPTPGASTELDVVRAHLDAVWSPNRGAPPADALKFVTMRL